MSRKRSVARWFIAPLALACGAANALGLGQIQVKSNPGEPFVAQIPIIISSPDEMVGLRAGLADPETFERIGLAAPVGTIADLRFRIITNDRGLPSIEVFTSSPIHDPSLTFLVELNWGQGKMVREFSALVNSPQSMASTLPMIEQPEAAPSNLIVRETIPIEDMGLSVYETGKGLIQGEQSVWNGQSSQEESPQIITPEEMIASQDQPIPTNNEQLARPPVPAPVRRRLVAGENMATIAKGQVLSQIAKPLVEQEGRTLNETMMALFKANPHAFIRGNINLIKEGAVLRAPGEEHWNSEEVTNSGSLVAQHVAQWREWNEPVEASQGLAQEGGKVSPADSNTASSGARLAIVSNPDDSQTKNSSSGQSDDGQGDLLTDKNTDADGGGLEESISRQLELNELRSRIEELEALMASQQKLIEMKDTKIAEAQEALKQHQKSQERVLTNPPPKVWWSLGGLLVLLAGAWAWVRGRLEAKQRKSRAFLRESQKNDPQEN